LIIGKKILPGNNKLGNEKYTNENQVEAVEEIKSPNESLSAQNNGSSPLPDGYTELEIIRNKNWPTGRRISGGYRKWQLSGARFEESTWSTSAGP